MKNNIQITVTYIKNADAIADFAPVEGTWDANATSEEINEAVDQVEAVIAKQFAPFNVKVELFHSNGHAITGDMPTCGTFLATRI